MSSKNVGSNRILVWVQKRFGLKNNLSQKEFENKNIMDSKHFAVKKKLRQIKNVGSQNNLRKKSGSNFFWLQLSPGQMMHGQLTVVSCYK